MRLCVMMAAYNTVRFVEDAVESVLRQGTPNLEIGLVVVNDGSTDGTGEVLRTLAERSKGVTLIETPNQGVTRARNNALGALPDCDFVSFLDSDDLSPAGHFARTIARFDADASLD